MFFYSKKYFFTILIKNLSNKNWNNSNIQIFLSKKLF